MGVQITSFLFFSVGEIAHLLILTDSSNRMLRVSLIIMRALSYLISAIIGLWFLQKLVRSSIEYTKGLTKMQQKQIINKE
jgi:hypothetical protein